MQKRSFGTTRDGKEVFLFSLENKNGVKAEITVSQEENQVISVVWTNETNKAIDELRFSVERLENGEWKAVPFAEDFGFPEIFTRYYPTEKGTINIDTVRTFGQALLAGSYRLILSYHLVFADRANDTSVAVFDIG